jgi:hypothetical protein
MIAAYETRRTVAGVPATFEVIFGAAFGAAAQTSGAADSSLPGEYVVPLTALGRSRP